MLKPDPLNINEPLPNDESFESIEAADKLIAKGGSDMNLRSARDLLDAARK